MIQNQINNLKDNIQNLQRSLNICEGEYGYLEKDKKTSDIKTNEYKHELEVYQKCIELLQLVSHVTREKTQKHFEDLITSGLQYVFGEGYYFKLIFDRRGNLTTLDFKIVTPEHDEPSNPIECESGGVLDLISLILRIVIMEVNTPKINGFLLLDEPLTKLDKNKLPKAIEFIKQLSEKLNKQIILITHSETIINSEFNKIEIDS